MIEFFIFVIKFFFDRPRLMGFLLCIVNLMFYAAFVINVPRNFSPVNTLKVLGTIAVVSLFSGVLMLIKSGVPPELEPPLIVPEEHGVTALTKILQHQAAVKHHRHT